MNERQKIIQLLSSPNPDSIQLGWSLAANFAPDLLELRKFGEGVFGVNVLDLSYKQLIAIPESIGQLQKLQVLYLYNNQLLALPEAIGQLKNLRWLYLDDNQLSTLPKSIGQLQKLEMIFLKRNAIPYTEQQRIRKLLPNCTIFS